MWTAAWTEKNRCVCSADLKRRIIRSRTLYCSARLNGGRLMNWAKDIGDEVLLWVQAQLKQKQHEQQAYRVSLGLLSLSRNYPANRGGSGSELGAIQHIIFRHDLKVKVANTIP